MGHEKMVGRCHGEQHTFLYRMTSLYLQKLLIVIEGSGNDYNWLLACIWYKWLISIFTKPPTTTKLFQIYYDYSRHLYVDGNQTYNHKVEEAEICKLLPRTMHLKNKGYRASRKVYWFIHSATAVSHEDLDAIRFKIEELTFRCSYKRKYKCRYLPSKGILIVIIDLVNRIKDYINPKYLLYFGDSDFVQYCLISNSFQFPPLRHSRQIISGS
jgi:hypothetical protein